MYLGFDKPSFGLKAFGFGAPAVYPPITTTSVVGFIAAGSTAELLSQAGGRRLMTTNWANVVGGETYKLNFPQSDRYRAQSKSATGAITYLVHPDDPNASAHNKLLTVPSDAVQVRIYHTQLEVTPVQPTSIQRVT